MDGVDGSPASVYGAGLMDFAKYVTLTGHTFVAAGFVINEERFQSFPIDIQDIIVEGAQLAEITDNGWVPLSELEALETMRDEGAVITIPTSEEYEQWREIAYKIGMEHIEGSVKDKALIQELMEEVERVEKELKEERARIAGRLQ